jgi:hypothetical protein
VGHRTCLELPDAEIGASKGANVRRFAFILASIYFAGGQIAFADEFQKVRCGADIPKALIGQHGPAQRIVVLEKKYAALGLKHLGADEMSDRLSSVNWLICGNEFMLLVDRGGLVSDAVPFPPHSRASPAFSGICQSGRKDLPDIFVGTLDGASKADLLPVVTAWKIDKPRARFVKVPSGNLLCPRSGIYTVDGGL